MNDNVVELKTITKLDLPPERILDRARDAGMQIAIVIGLDSDGEFYFASSAADGGTALWWIEKAKKKLLEYGDD